MKTGKQPRLTHENKKITQIAIAAGTNPLTTMPNSVQNSLLLIVNLYCPCIVSPEAY